MGKEDASAIALLKVQCSQTMEFCAREAMQIMGGMSYMRGNRVERIYREGSRQRHRWRLRRDNARLSDTPNWALARRGESKLTRI